MPKSSIHRQQLHRERRKRGLRCVTLEIRNDEIGELICRGLLSAGDRSNGIALRNALHQFFDRYLQAAG